MADDLQQPLPTDQDWQGNPPPQPTGPPPSWDELKATPEFQQLNPNDQLFTFQHWRSDVGNHVSTLPGYDESVQQEFNNAAHPEQQRLAEAAQQYTLGHPDLQDHLNTLPQNQQPEGFWGTLGRTVATRAFPTVATVGGALGGGLLGIESGPGALATAGLGGAAAGIGAEKLQKNLMGDEWFNNNQKQIEINAQAHPVAHQIGTMLTFLASTLGGGEAKAGAQIMGKVIGEDALKKAAAEGTKLMPYLFGAGERAIAGGAQFARAGAVGAAEEKGEVKPGEIAGEAARGAFTGGALGLFPAAKTLLGSVLKGATTDSAAMALAGGLYDQATTGQPIDWQKIANETKGNAPAFAIQNAILGWMHGMPMRIKSGEAAPPEAKPVAPSEELNALKERQKQLQEKQQTGQLAPDQAKELEDLNKLATMKGEQPAAPEDEDLRTRLADEEKADTAMRQWTPEQLEDLGKIIESEKQKPTPPKSTEAQPAPEAQPELPPEKQALMEKVNKGLEAGEQPAADQIGKAGLEKETTEPVEQEPVDEAEAMSEELMKKIGVEKAEPVSEEQATALRGEYKPDVESPTHEYRIVVSPVLEADKQDPHYVDERNRATFMERKKGETEWKPVSHNYIDDQAQLDAFTRAMLKEVEGFKGESSAIRSDQPTKLQQAAAAKAKPEAEEPFMVWFTRKGSKELEQGEHTDDGIKDSKGNILGWKDISGWADTKEQMSGPTAAEIADKQERERAGIEKPKATKPKAVAEAPPETEPLLPFPTKTSAGEDIAVSKRKAKSAADMWAKVLEDGALPKPQELSKAFGDNETTKRLTAELKAALKKLYPEEKLPEGTPTTLGFAAMPTGEEGKTKTQPYFTNDVEGTTAQLRQGWFPKIPEEIKSEDINPRILYKKNPDGSREVIGVDHPEHGELRSTEELKDAEGQRKAKNREVQVKAGTVATTLPELTEAGKAKTVEDFKKATPEQLDKLNEWMKSHGYTDNMPNDPTGELRDAIEARVLRVMLAGNKPNNSYIKEMIKTFEQRQGEGIKTEIPTAETGKELRATPGAEEGATPTTDAELALKKAGVADPQGLLDQINEGLQKRGRNPMTMEDLAEFHGSKEAEETGEAAATPEISSNTLTSLQNKSKLFNLGFDNKENPVGESLKTLAKDGNTLERFVANLMLKSGVDWSKVKVLFDDHLASRGNYTADASKNSFKIYLNPSAFHGAKGIEGTLLHEAYHHITTWKLDPSYVPNKYEAAAIKQLKGIMNAGREAAFKDIFGRDPKAQAEADKFISYIKEPNKPENESWMLMQLGLDKMLALKKNFDRYYPLSNLKEMATGIVAPEFHDFISKTKPTPVANGGAFKNLLQQFRAFLTKLVAGRPTPEAEKLNQYLEAAATLGVEPPRTRGVQGTEAVPMTLSKQDAHDQEIKWDRDQMDRMFDSTKKGLETAGVPITRGGAYDPKVELVRGAQKTLEQNPNAAVERMKDIKSGEHGMTAKDVALFHAYDAQLFKAMKDAGEAGVGEAEARAKFLAFSKDFDAETSKAGETLQSLKGAIDIDTGTFQGLEYAYWKKFGKGLSPNQQDEASKIVDQSHKADIAALTNSIKEGQAIARMSQGVMDEFAKPAKLTLAEKAAAAKAGVPEKDGQLTFDLGDPKDPYTKLKAYLAARFGDKAYKIGKENLTIQEVGQIWKYIKATYLDGSLYVRPDELREAIATDLNIDKRLVDEAISRPKTLQKFVNDRYVAQAQQRAITQITRQWMEESNKHPAVKILSTLWELPRSIAVVGHVNPSLTHAGGLLFRPSVWKTEIPSIMQAFRAGFLGGKGLDAKAYHESQLQQVMQDENYGLFTKNGLAAKVGALDDIGQYNSHLGRLGVAGNRAMDILKVLRMQRANEEYQRVKNKPWFTELDQKGKNEVLKEMMSAINSETGTTTPGFTRTGRLLTGDWRMFMFAPRLEGARWQQMIVDPIRAAGLWAKGSNATEGEKWFRQYTTRRLVEQMGTMTAALAANAMVLKAIGSDDKINFLDPTRSDWMAFKVNGQTTIAPSSFLAPLRLSLSVALSHVIPTENRQPALDKIASYAFGKVTPTISDIYELARAKQNYTGRPLDFLPWAPEQKLTAREQKDPVAWYQYAMTKGPIPLSATAEGWFNALEEQGADPQLAKTIIGASIAAVSGMFAVHTHPTPPEKNTNL